MSEQDAMGKIKVLFVCLGNICRSPVAEGLFKHKVTKKGLNKVIEADSCGTSNYHIGGGPDERTIVNAMKNGIQLNHRGRQLTYLDLENFDFIVAMDRSNYDTILQLPNAEAHKEKILMMRSFDPQPDHEDVPDPYYGGEHDFQNVFDILDRSTEKFLAHLNPK